MKKTNRLKRWQMRGFCRALGKIGPLLVLGGVMVGAGLASFSARETAAFPNLGGINGVSACDCHYAGFASGFHRGGVARCNGCHTMHNSAGNAKMAYDQTGSVGNGQPHLLRAADSSSVCLYCHNNSQYVPDTYSDILVSTPAPPLGPLSLTPGGNFGWLKKSFTWTGGTSPGQSHGHNIVAQDFGYTADSRTTQSPGGTYATNKLSCISCHDPHGKYRRLADGSEVSDGPHILFSGSKGEMPHSGLAVGSYRLLAGVNYQTTQAPEHVFASRSPVAVVPNYIYDWADNPERDGDGLHLTVNRSEAETDTRVAYGQGMSEWCANCHSGFHGDGAGSGQMTRHPAGQAGKLGTTIAANYNAYLKTGDMTGSSTSSYSSLTPFEEGHADYAALSNTAVNSMAGPDASANVSCLSCHRAHASGWDSMGRWNFAADFLTVAGEWPGSDSGVAAEYHQGRTQAETRLAYYDRPATKFATWQRNLCNKCHAKD